MTAQAVNKSHPKTNLSKGFNFFFSEPFLHEKGVKEYYRYQLLHSIFFGGYKKYISIHTLLIIHAKLV